MSDYIIDVVMLWVVIYALVLALLVLEKYIGVIKKLVNNNRIQEKPINQDKGIKCK